MRTKFVPEEQAQAERKWVLFDAEQKVVGRLASEIASVLRGKNKPTFAPHQDTGDFVIVVNAEKAVFTGNKSGGKKYYTHSLYPGGVKEETAGHLLQRDPAELLRRAVWGMLPKTSLGKRQLKKLRVYRGTEHGHEAQTPQTIGQ